MKTMTIRKARRRQNSTSSLSYEKMEPLSPQQALWGFGSHLIHELALSDRGDTLSHWLAHYLAELFEAEGIAVGKAKVRLGDKIIKTMSLLWKNREQLPRYADPTERYSRAFAALRAVHSGMAAQSKWEQFCPGEPMPATLKFYEKSARLGILGILELMPSAPGSMPPWLAQLTVSNEANLVEVLSDAYSRLYSERSATLPESTPKNRELREMRTKLLDELQELLDKMRVSEFASPLV